eukprot:jgi/Chlat1/8871/Chrsp92S08230
MVSSPSPAVSSEDETQSIDELSDDDEEDDSSERKEQLLFNNGQLQSFQLRHGPNILGRQSVKQARDTVRAESWRSAGPSSQNAILLESPKLSARHVCIDVDDHECFVMDLGSKNGSWLKSASPEAASGSRQRLRPYRSHSIYNGDILFLADVQLSLKLQRKSQESSMFESEQPSRLQLNMSALEKQDTESETREPHHSGDVPAAVAVPAGQSRTFARISSLREWQSRGVCAVAEETQIVDVGVQALPPAATAEQTQILPVVNAREVPNTVPAATVTAEELASVPPQQMDNVPETRSGTQESIPNSNSDEPLLCSEQLVLTNSSQSPKKPSAPAILKRRGSRLAFAETAVAPSNASPDSADQADGATPPSSYYPSILNTDALGTANTTSYRSDAHAPDMPNGAHEEAEEHEHEYKQPAETAAGPVGKADTSSSASDATTMSDAGADDGVDDAKLAPAIDVHNNIAGAFITEMESLGAPLQAMQAANTAPAPLYATHTQAQLLDTQDTSQLAAAADQALNAVAGMVAAVTSSQAPDSAPVASLWRPKPEHKLPDSGSIPDPPAHGSPIGACTQDVANVLIQQLPSVAERRLSFGNALAHAAPTDLEEAPVGVNAPVVGVADVALAEPSSFVPDTEVNTATDPFALKVATKRATTVDVDGNDGAPTPRMIMGRKRKGKQQPAAKASRPSSIAVPEAAQDTPDEPQSTRRAAAAQQTPSPVVEDQPAVKRQRAHKLDAQQPVAAAADTPIRVLFSTSLKDNLQLVKQAERLGAEITQLVTDCTHFVAQEFKRTVHMLSAIAAGVWVVRPGWVEDASKYLLCDKRQEKQHCFSMEQSLQRARRGPVFAGLSFIITPGVSNPSAEDVAAIIKAAGGDVIDDPTEAENKSKVLVVACEADMVSCKQYAAADVPVHTSEFVLRSVVTQQLLDKHAHRLGVCPGPITGKRSGKRKGAQ